MKIMYAVVHKDYIDSRHFCLMTSNKKAAIFAWEKSNEKHCPNISYKKSKKNGWMVQAYKVTPVPKKRRSA